MRKESVPLGTDVVEYVGKLSASGAAWVAAVGTLEGVELAVIRGSGEDVQSVPGRVALVSLLGPPEGPLMATLVRADTGGSSLVAGRLVKGRSAGVALSVEVASSAPASPPTVAPVKVGSVVPGRPSAPPAATWADVARPRPPEDDDEADELPKAGDRVDHFVFGLCEVLVVRGERLKITDIATGKLKEISVGPFKVGKPVVVDGKRVFKLTKRA
jgi:hypothetical protein